MRVTEISIRLGETINQGNYNNAKYEIEAKAVLAETDELRVALDDLEDQVRSRCAAIRRTLVRE